MASYNFTNICGAPFEGGDVSFNTDGHTLFVPTGNRVTLFDLRRNRSQTLPFEARQNIRHICFSPSAPLLVTIDEAGRCLVVNLIKSIVLSRFWFRRYVTNVKFSPCGRYLVTTIGKAMKLWDAPTLHARWLFSFRRKIQHHADTIVSVCWSWNSKYLCTGSKDLTVRIFSRDPIEGFRVISFVDHRSPLRGAFFTCDMTRVLSAAIDGTLIGWKWTDEKTCIAQRRSNEEEAESRGFFLQKSSTQNCRDITGNSIHRKLRADALIEKDLNDATGSGLSLVENAEAFPDYIGGTWTVENKVFCNQASQALMSSVVYNPASKLLVAAFSNGTIGLYSCPDFSAMYTLSMGNAPLDSLDCTADGEWIGIGCSQLGQIVVWEWRSETYILKQQAHGTGIRCVACSPTLDKVTQSRLGGDQTAVLTLGMGQRSIAVVTGGEDGKVKLWDAISGFNYITFSDHTACVNDVVFTPQGNAVISASDDGTVKCYDLARYRNFRTFNALSEGTQFSCVAVDGSGEIVVAGTRGQENIILVWSLQTGKQLEHLSGHTEYISSVRFHPHPGRPGVLVSGSWDKTIRVWDIFGRTTKGGEGEPLGHSSSVLSVAFDPRGNNQLAVSTLCGNIWFWNVQDSVVIGSIDGLRDIQSGRRFTDKFAANNSRSVVKKNKASGSVGGSVNQNQNFTSLTYSSNGTWLLAAAKTSPRVCVYASDDRELLFTVSLTQNMSLDALLLELNSKWMTESGMPIREIDNSDEDEDEVFRRAKRIQEHAFLPGVESGDYKSFHKRKEFQIWQLHFSQDGQQWCAATSHGLFTYALDTKNCISLTTRTMGMYGMSCHGQLDVFRPNLITKAVSPAAIMDALKRHPAKAMILALALNDFTVLTKVYTSIAYRTIPIVVESIPPLLLPALLSFLGICFLDVDTSTITRTQKGLQNHAAPRVGGSPHIQYHLHWLMCILSLHLSVLQHTHPIKLCNLTSEVSETSVTNASAQMLMELGAQPGDIYTLLLLLLRSVQRLHSTLGSLFCHNLRTLDVLLMLKS